MRSRGFFIFSLFSILIHSLLFSLELKPWFDPMFELQSRVATIGQLYTFVDTKEGLKKHPAGNFFLDLEFYSTLWQNWSVEVEAVTAATRHRTFGPDTLSLTGRYLWLDDVVGDPLSLTTGVTLYKVFKPARRDLSVFHHGGIEAELHAAVGKEASCLGRWRSRVWAVAGFGIGDLGSPWMRADAHWEHRWCDLHQLRLSLLSILGLGQRSLKHLDHFHGYGPIQHHSVDAGVRYTYLFDHGIALNAEYAFRLYARNCPAYVHFILVILDYPVSL